MPAQPRHTASFHFNRVGWAVALSAFAVLAVLDRAGQFPELASIGLHALAGLGVLSYAFYWATKRESQPIVREAAARRSYRKHRSCASDICFSVEI